MGNIFASDVLLKEVKTSKVSIIVKENNSLFNATNALK